MFRRSGLGAACALAALLCAVGGADARAASGWAPTGEMSVVHRAHGAVKLQDGRVLVVSGFSSSTGEVPQSELYDPATGTWRVTAPIGTPRHYATATLLQDGRVLVAGGFAAGGVVTSTELYDPRTDSWSAGQPMTTPRNGHSAVRLAGGRVLVAGGADTARDAKSTGEVYDPITDTWTPVPGAMSTGRENAQTTLLADGRVLIAGGFRSTPSLTFFPDADLYDPVLGTWSRTGDMLTARGQGGAALLADGRVLVASGVNRFGFVTTAELYDPVTGTWSLAPGVSASGNVSYAEALEGGTVLLTSDGAPTGSVFDPATGLTQAAPMSASRGLAPPVRLDDGRVLVAGGSNLRTAEVYTPPTTRGATGGAFADVGVGEAAERDVTFANTGRERLRIAGAAVTGAADFTLAGGTCGGAVLAPAATCVVRVRFAPTEAGARAAQLTLDDNAETSGAVPLSGTGVASAPAPDAPRPVPATPSTPSPTTPTNPKPQTTAPDPRAVPQTKCSSRRRLVVRLGLRKRERLRSGTATLNGKPLTRLAAGSRSVVVDLRKRPYGTYVLRVRGTTRAGERVDFTRTYRTCRRA